MATEGNSEKQPLLRNENVNYRRKVLQPQSSPKSSYIHNVNYSEYVQGQPSAPAFDDFGISPASSVHVATPAPVIQPDELPPPYTSSTTGTNAVVTCRVCGVTIDISGKDDKHVVQCSQCNEATPIKSAPSGKKYVRCPCNCLLICKVSSKKISCPRQNCKRIICLSPSTVASTPHSAGTCQVSCPYCQSSFPVNLVLNNYVRCIYCRKLCALIPEYSRKRALLSIILALSALVCLIIVAAATHSYVSTYPGIYFAYMLLAALIVAGLLMGFFYCTLKAVIIEPPT